MSTMTQSADATGVRYCRHPRRRTRMSPDFFTFASSAIDELVEEGRLGTSQTYAKATRSFAAFLCSEGIVAERAEPHFPMSAIDGDLIRRYNSYLSSRGVIRNSISFYNRTLRAIYNKAVRQCGTADAAPFREVYTGIDRTASRALDERQMSRLSGLNLGRRKTLEVARDLFIFSYATRGMSFVDMAYLKKSNVSGDRIVYSRRKSGARLTVRIETPVARIIRKYAREGSEYLLPILQDLKRSDGQSDAAFRSGAYIRYQSRLSAYNRTLKELSQLMGGTSLPVSSYVSRHSWATAARNSSIPTSVISESLGHTSERTTRIYLAGLDGRRLDSANRIMVRKLRIPVSTKETNKPHKFKH